MKGRPTLRAEAFFYELGRCWLGGGQGLRLAPKLAQTTWSEVAAVAAAQGMTGFLYYALRQGWMPETPPTEELANWKAIYHRQALQGGVYESEGARLLALLGSQGIKVLVLKGYAYREELYPDAGMRFSADLDLLIRREDYQEAKRILTGQGFEVRASAGFAGPEDAFISFAEQWDTEISFCRKTGLPMMVDLHWGLGAAWHGYDELGLFPVDRHPWIEMEAPGLLAGAPAWRLRPESQFIHAAYHFALHHQFVGFKWLLEMARFLQLYGDSFDWEYIRNTVDDSALQKIVATVLMLTAEVAEDDRWVKQWREMGGCTGAQGLEYRFYRNRVFGGGENAGRFWCRILLPVQLKDRGRVLRYILFDRRAVLRLRLEQEEWHEQGIVWWQPIYLLYRILKERTLGK